MSEAALSRISNLIKVEDDLLKLDNLRQQFTKERNSIDSKLHLAAQQQIDSVVQNLGKLKTAVEKLSSVKSNIDHINNIYDESVTQVKEYDTIKQVSGVFQTMMQVQNLYTDIANYRKYLDHITSIIESELDAMSNDIAYPLYNFYRIHFNVTQARNFADYLEDQSKVLSDDIQSIVAKIVQPLRALVRKFDELLTEIVISITEAVKEGNDEIVNKVVRFIEHEATEDLKVSLIQDLKLVDKDILQVGDYSKTRMRMRHYKKFFFSKLNESLADTFDKCVEHFRQDKMLVYDNLEWLEDELVFVVHTLAPMFPPHWELSSFIQGVYYNKLHKFTMELINTNPPAEDLMRILEYDSHYNQFVRSLLTAEDSKKEQKSILGEDLKNSVLDDYLKVILSKMEEWNENLIAQESRSFIERDEAPDVFTYNQTIDDFDQYDHIISLDITSDVYVLPDFRTTLSMFKEQADVAADSGYGKVLVGVIESWSHYYNKRAFSYMQLVEDEVNKYMSVYNNEKYLIKESKTKRFLRLQSSKQQEEYDVDNMSPEELAQISKPGLVEYLAALGNTYEVNTDRLQDKFLPNYISKVHSTYQTRIEQAFQDTLAPSTDLNAQVIRSIADIIINDLLPALSTVFTKSWYDNGKMNSGELNMAQKIVETIAEYMEELRGYASYDLYSLTFTVVLDTFISSYLRIGYQNILHGDGKKIDPTTTKKHKSFSEAVNRDIAILYEGLDSLFSRKDAVYLLRSLTALELLTTLATVEDPLTEIPKIWEHEILDTYYYCSVEYVRGILLCRKDVEAKAVPPLMEKLAEIQREYHQQVDPPEAAVSTLNNFTYT